MTITPASTLGDVGFAVCTALDRVGVTAVLTGGSAATWYAPQAYQSRDLDFVITLKAPAGVAALTELGFVERGQVYRHPSTHFTLDFPRGPLAVGDELLTTWRTERRGTELLHMITPTDSCRDRLGWAFEGGSMACGPDNNPGVKVSVAVSIEGWRLRNGCTPTPVITTLDDTTSDGTTTRKHVYACPAGQDVVLYEVVGGGHGWPNGHISGANNDTIATDFSMNRHLLEFFTASERR